MSATDCYCRGRAICEAGHHTCADCTCDTDGAPQDRESVTMGWVNPSAAREAAWLEKLEANR